ncbi:MAG TPA: chemotaxis protein CheW [Kineosporiaceae bacterium]|nr:chemotaxis protein CheW [Kineosporiaceae bacterium]
MSRPIGIPAQIGERAAQMRADFDSAFSRLPVQPPTDLIDVLELKIGDDSCLLRLSEVAELVAHPVFTPVPTPVPALIGIAACRGSPIAAYDLGLLLGRAPVAPRWLVIVAAEPGVGLVFEQFDGYQRISLGPGGSQRLIEMTTLIAAITQLAQPRSTNQENDS